MVKPYKKGYRAERDLVHILAKLGYMVVRTPRSGRIGLPSPDIIAAKNGKLIVIECKSRAKGFQIPLEQLNELKEWEDKAGAKAYVALKISRKGFFFIDLVHVMNNNGNIGKKFIEEKSIGIDMI